MKSLLKVLFAGCLVVLAAVLISNAGSAGSVVLGIALAVLLFLGVAGLFAAAATTVALVAGALVFAVGIVAALVFLPVLIPILILIAPLVILGAVVSGIASVCG